MSTEFFGSDIGFKVGEPGIFVRPDLTSEKETGLGGWTDERTATALTTGSGMMVGFSRRSCRGAHPPR